MDQFLENLLLFAVALLASVVVHRAFAFDNADVAGAAIRALVQITAVIEGVAVDLDLLRHLPVARATVGEHGVTLAVLLGLEVADEAVPYIDRHMLALDDLPVTGHASELLFAAHLIQVVRMREGDSAKLLRGTQRFFRMALQAARVRDLRVYFPRALPVMKMTRCACPSVIFPLR